MILFAVARRFRRSSVHCVASVAVIDFFGIETVSFVGHRRERFGLTCAPRERAICTA
jgi:hypothetical protein